MKPSLTSTKYCVCSSFLHHYLLVPVASVSVSHSFHFSNKLLNWILLVFSVQLKYRSSLLSLAGMITNNFRHGFFSDSPGFNISF